LPAQRIEEDSLRVLKSLHMALKRRKVPALTVKNVSKVNKPVGQVGISAMLESALPYGRELLLKVIEHVLSYEESADIVYNILEDFDVELADRFLLNSLNVVFQESRQFMRKAVSEPFS
jgi:hypothetical protein